MAAIVKTQIEEISFLKIALYISSSDPETDRMYATEHSTVLGPHGAHC